MFENIPADLKLKFDEVDRINVSASTKKLYKDTNINNKKISLANKESFDLYKNLVILTGTIFGSSIALATGRLVSIYFVIGEVFLFFAIIAGIIILNTSISAKYWDFSFSSKMSLSSCLLLCKGKIDKFIEKEMEDLVRDHEKILESDKKSFLNFLLKIISVDRWPLIFNLSFLIGILLILISIIPFNTKNYNSAIPNEQINIINNTPIPTDTFYIPLK